MKKIKLKLPRDLRLCLIACGAFLAALVPLMAFTGNLPWQSNSYNSYTLQALAWLNGRLDIADGPDRTWLELTGTGVFGMKSTWVP